MREQEYFNFRTGVVGYPLLFVLLIWIIYWLEFRLGIDFSPFGVYPRTIVGLRGILFSPFIHGDIGHLWHNTIPLLVLSSGLLFFYQKNAWKVLLIGVLFTGFFTWLLGRPANHVGASGVIYMLFGFLFFKGILTKHFRLIALSLVVVFIYGSMVWYILPIDPHISWEGHLSGLLVGTFLAFYIRKGIAKPPIYNWQSPDYNPEEDEFLRHFDDDGNFIEQLPEEDGKDISVIYDYKPKKNDTSD